MLVNCAECGREISDSADACPHCGHPLKKLGSAGTPPPPPATGPDAKPSTTPIFLIVSGLFLFFSLYVPRLIIIVPIGITVVCAGVSFARREKFRGAALVVGGLAIGLLLLSSASMPGGAIDTANLDAAKIADWNWSADPSFGTSGTIHWNVTVENETDKPISLVKVQFTSYDANKKLVATTFTYVDAIPPHGQRSDAAYADLYGTEKSANVEITEVQFAN